MGDYLIPSKERRTHDEAIFLILLHLRDKVHKAINRFFIFSQNNSSMEQTSERNCYLSISFNFHKQCNCFITCIFFVFLLLLLAYQVGVTSPVDFADVIVFTIKTTGIAEHISDWAASQRAPF